LRDLFAGEKIDLNVVKQREKAFIVSQIDKKVHYIEARRLTKSRNLSQNLRRLNSKNKPMVSRVKLPTREK